MFQFTRPATLARAGVIVGGLVLGYGAIAGVIASATHSSNPRLALSCQPNDPVASTTLAARLVGDSQQLSEDIRVRVDALARRSLAAQAINGPAVQLLVLVATQNGNAAATTRLASISDRLSRRDVGTQLLLIEAAVTRNDLTGALRHYDNALRVAPGSHPLLFPVLTTALEDRRLWPAFAPYLRNPPPWLGRFITQAIRTTERPQAYAAMIAAAGGLPATDELTARQAELLKRLADERRVGWVSAYYPRLPGADRAALTTLAFTPATTSGRYGPVTWSPMAMPGAEHQFVRGEQGQLQLNGLYDPGYDGQAASKLVYLDAGRYRLRARAALGEGSAQAKLRWTFTCVRPSGLSQIWQSAHADVAVAPLTLATVIVPTGCPALLARVDVRVAAGETLGEVRIDEVSLEPIAGT